MRQSNSSPCAAAGAVGHCRGEVRRPLSHDRSQSFILFFCVSKTTIFSVSSLDSPPSIPICSLAQHYRRIVEKGSDYDHYTMLFAKKKLPTSMITSLLSKEEGNAPVSK